MNNLLEISKYLEHYPSLLIVLTTAAILTLGIFSQILSNRTSIPAIIFLMVSGTIFGKYGLNLINPDVYGKTGIRAIIAICVAIIVFEGGLLIDIKHLKHNFLSILGLITTNVFITILGMTVVTSIILDLDLKIALLYSSIVSVTGPTVIAPILKRIHIHQKVKSILETEAVLVDAVGVITAVSIFNYITSAHEAGFVEIFNNIFVSLIIGILTGTTFAYIVKKIVIKFSPLSGELTRLLILGLAVVSYSVGELLSHESGITSVAVAGMIIGNSEFPYKKSIKEFKGDLTILSITIVFLLLASDLNLSLVADLGFKGVLCVLILMLIIRPLGVFTSMMFEKISWKEKLFISSLGPRGIVAASAATFFSIELEAFGIEGRDTIRSLVFLTVLLTVIIEGGGAKYMADLLKISPKSILIIGGGAIGKELALSMQNEKESVIIIENNTHKADDLLKEGLYVIQSDATNLETYKKISINNIKSLIATSEDDWLNLRVCQIGKTLKSDLEVISIINDNKSSSVFENLGIKIINTKQAVINALKDKYNSVSKV